MKKTVIERQCQGLVEFVEPDHTLDMIAGQTEAVKRLQDDARLITDGRLDAAPMGYLICGAVGTGKTFLAECYAGSIGIPCVSLKLPLEIRRRDGGQPATGVGRAEVVGAGGGDY